jgi:hypothetical protein
MATSDSAAMRPGRPRSGRRAAQQTQPALMSCNDVLAPNAPDWGDEPRGYELKCKLRRTEVVGKSLPPWPHGVGVLCKL